jgi:3-oxoacyl-(acyl-carrier-protein) synthase
MLKRAVITGMGVVSPNGIGKTAFCRAILDGKSGVKNITRFDASDLPVKIAGEIQDFNELDWIEPKERKHVSRSVPMAIAAASEALEDSGIDHSRLSLDEQREIGVVLGSGGGANDFTDQQYQLYFSGKIKQVSIFTIPSGTMGTMASEVSMRYGLRGLSHVITTGCTSSTDAIAYAMRQIQLGIQPMMMVGGVDTPLSWGILKGFTLMKIMTEKWNAEPQRASRPFNADRSGFVVAEGAWIFVLEEYEHAVARGARIYAEVVGYGATSDGYDMVAPSGEGAERCMRMAMSTVKTKIDYINPHATSTPAGDPPEIDALRRVFGVGEKCPPISATKALTGHSLGATGVQEAIYSLLMMNNGFICESAHIQELDPVFADMPIVRKRIDNVRIGTVLSNSFGFGGTNATLVFSRLDV